MSESPRLPSDQEQRQQARAELTSNLLVEASAGTGKTTALVGRLLELIKAEPPEGAPLRNIAAVTFTEKAAGELKSRLREELEKSLTDAGEDRALQKRLTEALEELESARLGTVHSFCATLLRERPVEAGLDPEFTVLDPVNAEVLEEEVWREWLEEALREEHPGLRALAALGVILPKELKDLCNHLNANRDLLDWLPKPQPMPRPADARKELRALHAQAVRCVKQKCRESGDKAALKVTEWGAVMESWEDRSPDGQAVGLVRDLSFGSVKQLGNKKNWQSPGALDELRQLIGQAEEVRGQFATRWSTAATTQVIALARGYLETLARRKEELAVVDFQDLLLLTRDLLKNSKQARRSFKGEIKRLLIDEFQDTDPLQAEIAFYLAERDDEFASDWERVKLGPGKLFVVGDPKQSIYRFRRADIELFEHVSKLVQLDGRKLELSQNFRSAPAVLDRVNALFEPLIQAPEEGAYQPNYVPLAPFRETKGGAVLLCPPPGLELPTGVVGCRTLEANALAAFLRRAVAENEFPIDVAGKGERPLEYGDVVLLFRTTTGIEHYEDALRDYGIPYRMAGGKRLYARQEIKSLVAVLRAIDSPADGVALYAALKSPFFGLSDEQLLLHHANRGLRGLDYLEADLPDDAVRPALELLRNLHARRNRVSTPALLHTLFRETQALSLFALKPLGEQRVANLLKVMDTARALTGAGYTFRQFVSWLRTREHEQQAEEESPTTEEEEGDQGRRPFVELLTIHKAKGLERPFVVLANASNGDERQGKCLVDRTGEQLHLRLGSKDSDFKTPGFQAAAVRESQRWEAEEVRLLYVALTRAQNWILLPYGWKSGWPDGVKGLLRFALPYLPPLESLRPGAETDGWFCYDTRVLAGDLKRPEQEPFRLKLPETATQTEAAREAQAARERWAEATRAAIDRASWHPETVRPSALADEARVHALVEDTDGMGGMAFGDLVHRLLAACELDPEKLEAARAQCCGPSPSSEASEALDLVATALESPLLTRARAADARWHELPFSLVVEGGQAEGVIDLVFREGDHLVLVDFKTDRVAESDAHAAADAYAPQVEQYAQALEQLTGLTVVERLVFFLRTGTAVELPPST